MNIEELSKAQLLLLTVMVNFIVSIATGVLTVSLLDQAPIQVSQGVDRVVERTIQAVAAPIQTSNPVVNNPISNPIKTIANVVSPQPVPPTNEQLLTAAIGNDAARTVLIYRGATTTTAAIAFGTYLPKSHAVVTAFNGDLPGQATIAFMDGSSFSASLSKNTPAVAIYGFANNAKLPSAPDAILPSASKLKAGQTVASLTKDSDAVTGIISKVGASTIDTSLVGVPAGGGVVDLSGQVIGIGSGSAGKLISADAILTLLQDTSAVK